jgi:acetyltransferase-like isoleucine patch superfamily enzyme
MRFSGRKISSPWQLSRDRNFAVPDHDSGFSSERREVTTINLPAKSHTHFEDPLGLLPWGLSKLYALWLRSTYPFAHLGHDLSVHYTFMANRAMAPRMQLGNSVTIGKDVWLNIIPEATEEINIIIDDNCSLGPRSWISARNHIHLEQDVKVGPSVLIMDHGHTYVNPNVPIRTQPPTAGGRIRIERGCRIGQGSAIVCSGRELVLGQNCVVAPNAVVLRSHPPFSVISGNPSRVIEQLDPSLAASMP